MGNENASLVAFALRDKYAETVGEGDDERPAFQGGHLALGGETFDVGQELDDAEHQLEDGRKVLVVDTSKTTALGDLLRSYRALESVPVPEGATAVKAYNDQSMPALRADAQRRRFAHIDRRKPDLAARLEAHDDALAKGDDEAAELIRAGDPTPTDPTDPDAGDAGASTQEA